MRSNSEKKESRVGIWGVLVKIGSKFSAVFVKFAKALKVGKLALAAISMASYAYMFTWKFSLMIMVMLFIHESGHIWAMKHYGMKTKGIYFIPFVGGAAVAEGEFPSRRAEVVIAIMGPIWGFALALLTGGAYLYAKNPVFAAASAWMALINLFNLLPINPLDGGRIMKSIAFSIGSTLGLAFMIVGIAGSLLLIHRAGLGLVALITYIGIAELVFEFKASRKWVARSLARLQKQLPQAEAEYQAKEVEYEETRRRVEGQEVGVAYQDLFGITSESYQRLTNLRRKIRDRESKLDELLRTNPKPLLSGYGLAASAFSYLLVAGSLWGLMHYMNHVPGADLAMKVLMG